MSRLSRPVRVASLIVAAALAAAAFTGCSENRGDKDVVRKAIARTRLQSRKFVYQEHALSGPVTQVTGLVEDDFRYAADLQIDGTVARQEVAHDDAFAIRFPDGSQAHKFIDTSVPASPETRPGDLSNTELINTLQAGQWAEDA